MDSLVVLCLSIFKSKKWLVSILFFWSFALQSQTYTSTHISLEEGLSQSSVNAIAQDQKGFLWLGTQDGLNCFDGYNFKVFKHEPFDEHSLAETDINKLLFDRKNRLWVGMRFNGLSLFNAETENFKHFRHDPDDSTSLSDDRITALYEDEQARLWVGTENGFNRLMEDKNGRFYFERYYLAGDPKKQSIYCFFEDSQGLFWIGSKIGLAHFNRLTACAENVSGNGYFYKKTNIVTAISEEKNGHLILGGLNKIMTYAPKNDEIEILTDNKDKQKSFFVTSITSNPNGNTYIATAGRGLLCRQYDIENGAYHRGFFLISGEDDKPLKLGINIKSIHLDQFNPRIIWLGYATSGLDMLRKRSAEFHTHKLKNTQLQNLETRFITSFTKTKNRSLWIGTDKALLQYSSTGFRIHRHQKKQPLSISANYIHSLLTDQKNRLWVASASGLDRAETDENGNIIFKNIQFSEGSKKRVSAHNLYQDKKGYIYVLHNKNIGVWDENNNHFTSWQPQNISSQVLDKIGGFTSVLRDSKDRLWLGSSQGLMLARDIKNPLNLPISQKWKHYEHDPTDTSSLRSQNILSMTEDSKGQIWLSTTNGLIQVLDKNGELKFKSYTEKDGLVNNFVYGVLEDSKSHALWISTNGGLSRFSPKYKSFESFDSSDGLQSNEFNSGAFYRDSEGEMFFGGVNGFTQFFPNQIRKDTLPPHVYITSYRSQNNEEYNLLLADSQSICLQNSDNTFTINFIALNYANPKRQRYKYKLLGLHSDWVECGNNRQVSFVDLQAGEYVFKVIGSNGYGAWNDTGDQISISIDAPFWEKTWFYGIVLLAISFLFLGLHQYRLQQKVNRVMELERVRKNAAADFHDELGHKLTIISLFGEIVKKKLASDKSVHPQLDKIITNANSLYFSMKDLLWVLDPNKDSAWDMAVLLRDFGVELFDKTGVDFHAEGVSKVLAKRVLSMDEKRHIVLMFKEVMNNALRHAKSTDTQLTLDLKDSVLHLKFTDNGQGFDPKSLSQNGNGLSNLHTRAEKIGADLKISSGENGTVVELDLEISRR